MPILHLQLSARGKDPQGQEVTVPPSKALLVRGPILQVTLTLLQSMAQALIGEGREVPKGVSGWALLDTGASTTCVDEAAAQQIGLPAVDTATMMSASDAASQRNVYPVTIEIAGLPVPLHVMRAMGAELSPQGIIALIGRDALESCTVHYNGPAGQFTLAM